jgi:hypothetical protein
MNNANEIKVGDLLKLAPNAGLAKQNPYGRNPQNEVNVLVVKVRTLEDRHRRARSSYHPKDVEGQVSWATEQMEDGLIEWDVVALDGRKWVMNNIIEEGIRGFRHPAAVELVRVELNHPLTEVEGLYKAERAQAA